MFYRAIILAVVTVTAAALAATSASAAMIPIYSNPLRSGDARAQIMLQHGQRCNRGGNRRAMRLRIGENTESCALSPPLLGRDLDVSVVAALMSGTPRAQRARAYVSVGLRAGDGGFLEARVYPVARRVQLVKALPDGEPRILGAERNVGGIRGVDQANRILLNAVNAGPPGNCRVVVRVNGRRVIAVNSRRCAQLTGRFATFGAGAQRNGSGITATYRALRIAVPSPFGR